MSMRDYWPEGPQPTPEEELLLRGKRALVWIMVWSAVVTTIVVLAAWLS